MNRHPWRVVTVWSPSSTITLIPAFRKGTPFTIWRMITYHHSFNYSTNRQTIAHDIQLTSFLWMRNLVTLRKRIVSAKGPFNINITCFINFIIHLQTSTTCSNWSLTRTLLSTNVLSISTALKMNYNHVIPFPISHLIISLSIFFPLAPSNITASTYTMATVECLGSRLNKANHSREWIHDQLMQ